MTHPELVQGGGLAFRHVEIGEFVDLAERFEPEVELLSLADFLHEPGDLAADLAVELGRDVEAGDRLERHRLQRVAGQDRRFIHTFGANGEFRPADIPLDLVDRCRVLYLGGYLLVPKVTAEELQPVFARARERGVKTVGATAHYVNAELDEGPIIAQQVIAVDHTHSPEDLVAVGRDGSDAAVWRSVDGAHWTRVARQPSLAASPVIQMTSVVATTSGFVAGGYVGSAVGPITAAFWHSTDGETWDRSAELPSFIGAQVLGLVVSPKADGAVRIVAVGARGDAQRAEAAAAWTSSDGATWQDAALAGDVHARAFREQLERVKPMPKVPEWERIATEVRMVAERAAHGEISVDEAARVLDARAARILEKRRWLLARRSDS